MRKQSFYFLSLAVSALFIMLFTENSFPENYNNIRVCVADNKDGIFLSVKGRYAIQAINSDIILHEGNNLQQENVTPTYSGLKLGEEEFKIYGVRVVPKDDANIFVDNLRLRGVVDIIRTEKLKLLVINHLDVEKYLYGVLYHETPHYWPMEVLKAQAVVARTFALHRKETLVDRDYDVTKDIYSQVYGGHASERQRVVKAVDMTRGEVLTYGGRILPAYYHSICAGHTEDAAKIFNINIPPLKGVKCPYCAIARGFRWKAIFSFKQLEDKLNKYGFGVKGLSFITEGKRDDSGRLETLKMKAKSGVKKIEGYKFRLAVGPNVIRSTNFTIDITRKGVIFRGQGWGHGVGMCQWGALGMARHRFKYKDILNFYYPGASISRMESQR